MNSGQIHLPSPAEAASMITYLARVLEKVQNRPGTWNSIRVGVFRKESEEQEDEEQIGSYLRNYPSLFRTFFPFRQGDKDYALYSPDYTATRVMELPSCRDIGGEKGNSYGFCPVDFYVPCYIERESQGLDDRVHRHRVNEPKEEDLAERITRYNPLDKETGERIVVERSSYPISPLLYYPFGFVAGCIWGDDSSWKIQYLDLSEAGGGIIKRDDRFGYIALPDELTLKQAIDMSDYEYDPHEEDARHITIAIQKRFDLKTGKPVAGND